MGLGLGMGFMYYNPSIAFSAISVELLIAAFKLRVAADSGNYEAEACQVSTLNALNV